MIYDSKDIFKNVLYISTETHHDITNFKYKLNISRKKNIIFLCEIRKTIIVHQRLHFQRLSFFSGRNRPRWLKNYKNAFTELESNSFSSIFLIVDIIYSLKLKISRSKCLQLFKQEYTGNMTDNISWQTITIFYKSSL